ncbi:MAG: Spy/CpxP family protein refolding chaperone [Gammaproteobacteria bacterium]
MKSSITLTLLLALVPLPALTGHDHGRHMQRMTAELQLSEDQAKAVQQIMQEQHEAWRALRESEGDREKKKAEMEALHAKTKERLAAVLNADQMQRMQAMEKRHGRGSDKEDRFGKLSSELNLTDEQSQSVRRILKDQREKMHALFKSEGSRDEKHSKLETLRAETRQQFAAVLSEEQLARMDEMRKEHHGMRRKHHDAHPESDASDQNSKAAPPE